MEPPAVQIVHCSRRRSWSIEHLGSAHHETEVEALKAAAWQRLAAGQREARTRLGRGRTFQWAALGFDAAAGGDQVFRALVLARMIEPTRKLDSLRALAEAGIDPPSYRGS